MAPTIEEKPVRYFLIQLKASTTGQWAPTIKVRADTVCENVETDPAVLHIFKRDKTVIAKIMSDTIAGWWIEEVSP